MFFSSSKNLMLVNERVLIIYPSDLFSVEFSSGISTPQSWEKSLLVVSKIPDGQKNFMLTVKTSFRDF